MMPKLFTVTETQHTGPKTMTSKGKTYYLLISNTLFVIYASDRCDVTAQNISASQLVSSYGLACANEANLGRLFRRARLLATHRKKYAMSPLM